ncbi:MAG: hypothetical protein EBX40_03495, partial [Gammaproteobacteria bacterium]|nr:hypothetical protein [Gammaproteobacteria bacterium]
LLKLLKAIEEDFLAKRSTVAMKIRRESGLAVGRPVGKHNQSLKLDIFRHDIENFLAHGISKVVIAKRIGCHAQTLYNYIEKRQLDVKRAIA